MKLISLIVSFAVITGLADFCCAANPAYNSDGLQLFDTVTSYESPLSSYQIKNKRDWKPITDESISGDLCVENNRIAVILRKNSLGPEVYYKIGARTIKAVTLYPVGLGDDPVIGVESFKVISRDKTHVFLDVLFRTESEKTASLECVIREGQATIEIRQGKDARKIIMQAESKYTVMPDLFANDLVIDPQRIRSDRLYLPGDNHLLLQMIDDGDAIIVCNWLSSDGEIVLVLSDDDGKKLITETIISFQGSPFRNTSRNGAPQNNSKIWITLMARKGVWYRSHTSRFNIYKHTQLDWAVPFPAYWRINYRRTDSRAFGLTDSFWNAETRDGGTFKLVPDLLEMDIVNGRYIIAGPQEKKRMVRRSVINQYTGSGWWTYRGWFIQPFCINRNSAFIKIPKFSGRRAIRYGGPIVIYPLLRVDTAHADTETVEDVLHNTFGPEYLSILDLADLNKRPEEDRFPPTCTTTEYCEKIFERNEEIRRKDQIVAILVQMNLFVEYNRQRLQEYLDWEEEMQALYQESHQANPNLAEAVKVTRRITRRIHQEFLRSRGKIKTPEHASSLSAKIVNLINHNSPSKVRMFKQICRRIRSIGDAQDELLGEYRNIVGTTRQKVSLLHTQETDPDVRKFLRLILAQTQKILRVRYDMEGK